MPELLPARRPSGFVGVGSSLTTVLMAVVVVSALYFGREVLVPIALAILMSFVLAPLVRLLQRWFLPRIVAVAVVVLIAFGAVFSLGSLMVSQVNQLAGDLPRYQSTLREKIHSLRAAAAATGTLERASEVLQDLSSELDKPNRTVTPRLGGDSTAPTKPIPVEVRQPDPGALQTLVALISPLIHPLATTGIVVIFVIFILMQMQDLRNRLVRLAGIPGPSAHHGGDRRRRSKAQSSVSHPARAQRRLRPGDRHRAVADRRTSAALWGILACILRFRPLYRRGDLRNLPLVLAAAVGAGLDLGAVDCRAVPGRGAACRARARTDLVQPSHRAFAGRGDRVGHVLDLAVGTDRFDPGYSIDDLSGRARPICGSAEIPRCDVRR